MSVVDPSKQPMNQGQSTQASSLHAQTNNAHQLTNNPDKSSNEGPPLLMSEQNSSEAESKPICNLITVEHSVVANKDTSRKESDTIKVAENHNVSSGLDKYGLNGNATKKDLCHMCQSIMHLKDAYICTKPDCKVVFCFSCYKKTQIDSFTKADFKHARENPEHCPVCESKCKCSTCKDTQLSKEKEDKVAKEKPRTRRTLKVPSKFQDDEEMQPAKKKEDTAKPKKGIRQLEDAEEQEIVNALAKLQAQHSLNTLVGQNSLKSMASTKASFKSSKKSIQPTPPPAPVKEESEDEDSSQSSCFYYDDICDDLKDDGVETPPYPEEKDLWEYEDENYQFLKPVDVEKPKNVSRVGGLVQALKRLHAQREGHKIPIDLAQAKYEKFIFPKGSKSYDCTDETGKKKRKRARGPYKKRRAEQKAKQKQKESIESLVKEDFELVSDEDKEIEEQEVGDHHQEELKSVEEQQNQIEEDKMSDENEALPSNNQADIEEEFNNHSDFFSDQVDGEQQIRLDMRPARIKGTNILVYINEGDSEQLGYFFDFITPEEREQLAQERSETPMEDAMQRVVENLHKEYKRNMEQQEQENPHMRALLTALSQCFDQFFDTMFKVKWN